MSVPTFPRYGECWGDCYICGFSFPRSQLMRHYKTRRLVDARCADEMSHADYLELHERRAEESCDLEQRVQGQGEVDANLGAGEGGAGVGGAGTG